MVMLRRTVLLGTLLSFNFPGTEAAFLLPFCIHHILRIGVCRQKTSLNHLSIRLLKITVLAVMVLVPPMGVLLFPFLPRLITFSHITARLLSLLLTVVVMMVVVTVAVLFLPRFLTALLFCTFFTVKCSAAPLVLTPTLVAVMAVMATVLLPV
eukprot:RCo046141